MISLAVLVGFIDKFDATVVRFSICLRPRGKVHTDARGTEQHCSQAARPAGGQAGRRAGRAYCPDHATSNNGINDSRRATFCATEEEANLQATVLNDVCVK